MKTTALLLAGAGLLGACSATPPPAAGPKKEEGAPPVERRYGKPFDKVWDAALAAVKSCDLIVESDRHDDLGGEIGARRADGRRVMVHVAPVDKNTSKVSVRADKSTVEVEGLLHERIAEKLGMGEAKAALFGGNKIEATYGADLPGALAAAERSCASLALTIAGKELHDQWAQLDARGPDSTPVRFRLDRRDERVTRVTFIAGRGKTEDSGRLLSAMKSEFERHIGLPAK